MRIPTVGDLVASEMIFMSLGQQHAVEMQAKKEFNSEDVKKAPNGKPLYKTQLAALRVVDGVPQGAENNVTLSVVEPFDAQLGQTYICDGAVWITPYERGGRVAISVIAERMTPANQHETFTVEQLADFVARSRQGKNRD